MSETLDALLKTYEGVESVAVIHSDEKTSTVAFVEVSAKMSTDEKLERAFMLTNSVEDAWWNNEGVTPMFDGKGCRSTSVGDMVLIGKEKYKCESMGWSKV